MAARIWYPPDEATAASTMAVFVEWLRSAAEQRDPPRWLSAWAGTTARFDPDAVSRWQAEHPASFGTALAAFAGLNDKAGVQGSRLRYAGPKEALVLQCGGTRLAWSRDELRVACGIGTASDRSDPGSGPRQALRADDGHEDVPALPADIGAALKTGTWEQLVAETAYHLLHCNTRPDDRVLCACGAGVEAAFGALTVGATLILADAANDELAVIAAKERARILRPPPSDRAPP